MSHRRTRRLTALTGALALAAVGYGAPARAAPTPTPAPGGQRGPAALSTPTPSPEHRLSPAWRILPPEGADCPTGSTMLPDNPIRSSMEPGALGVFAGNQMRQMTDQDGNSYLHAEGAVASPQDMLSTITFPVRTGRLYVKFDVRGGFAAKELSVLGTDRAGWYVAPAAGATPAADPSTWRTVRVDLTDSANVSTWDSGDTMRATWEWAGTGASGFDLDNVAVYWCSPVSRGEPGSFDGDGLADAKLVSPRGDLVFLRGEPKGTRPNSVWRGGTGWGGFTWIGASGDVNGDTHADLLGRTANGDFYVYYGDGVRSFTGGKRVGWGWGEMTSILPP